MDVNFNTPFFYIGDNNEKSENSQKKLTGNTDLISHFGLYYLYEYSKNKKIDNNSDFQSYINDIPVKQIKKKAHVSLCDLVRAPPTQKIPIMLFDQETLENAYTLRVGPFPNDPELDTSIFSNQENSLFKLDSKVKEEKNEIQPSVLLEKEKDIIRNSNNSNIQKSSMENKIPKVTLKLNVGNGENEKIKKKKRNFSTDQEDNEKMKRKHKKKKHKLNEYPGN